MRSALLPAQTIMRTSESLLDHLVHRDADGLEEDQPA
jgi:hypothetical protein